MPAHISAKFRSGNKNDSNDVVAIYEAAKQAHTHFVPDRTLEQQDLVSQHKHVATHLKSKIAL